YNTCVWEVVGLFQSDRVIKGSWLSGHPSGCSLKLNITDPNARGVSFSMKTEVDSPQGEYSGLGGLGIRSNSASDWKSYIVPVAPPSLQQWDLSPKLAYFTGNEFIYLRDIKLLVEQETTTTTSLAPTTVGETSSTVTTYVTTGTMTTGATTTNEGTTTTTEGTTTMTDETATMTVGTTTTAATITTTIPMTFNYWTQLPFSGNISEEEEGLKLQGSAYRVGNAVISKQWFDLQKSSVYFKWKARAISYAGWGPAIKDVKGGGYLTSGWSYGGSTVIPANEYIYTKISCDVYATPPKFDSWASTGNYIDHPSPGPTQLRHESSELSDNQVEGLKKAQLYWGFSDNYGGVDEYGIVAEVKIVNGTLVEMLPAFEPLYQGESNILDSSNFSSGSGGN
ncbi:hypothetical protein ACHAW6_000888, partial [Cyclotella cf. meneghiniana]